MENTTRLDSDELYRSALMPTTWGKRLANYIIDYIVFIILVFTGAVIWGVVIAVSNNSDSGFTEKGSELLLNVIIFLSYALYFAIMEHLLKGKTIGKMITKTRVVTTDGTRPTFSQILTRSFSRLVPFDALSFIRDNPQGWHDKWANTYVVDDNALPDKIYLEEY